MDAARSGELGGPATTIFRPRGAFIGGCSHHRRRENHDGKDRDQHERLARRSRPGPGRPGGLPAGRLVRPVRRQGPRLWREGMFEETLRIKALLLGRRSEEWFGSRWTERTDEWAKALNSLPKYVISATLDEPRWTNSTILRGDAVKEVAKLKQEIDGTIVVYASYQLARTLLEQDLVDEVRLFVFPVVLGDGERLFGETERREPLRLIGRAPSGTARPSELRGDRRGLASRRELRRCGHGVRPLHGPVRRTPGGFVRGPRRSACRPDGAGRGLRARRAHRATRRPAG